MKENETSLEPICIGVTEAARLLGISKPSLYQIVNREDFPSFKLGGRTLISTEGLRAWVREQAKVSAPDDHAA